MKALIFLLAFCAALTVPRVTIASPVIVVEASSISNTDHATPIYVSHEVYQMGQYRITIEGTGSHHNGATHDADYRARLLVGELQNMGHSVTGASFELLNGDGTASSTEGLLTPQGAGGEEVAKRSEELGSENGSGVQQESAAAGGQADGGDAPTGETPATS